MKRVVVLLSLVAVILLAVFCEQEVIAEVQDLVFKGSQFTSPFTMPLPPELSRKEEDWYRGVMNNWGSPLPPLPPSGGQLNSISPPEFRDILMGLGLIEPIELR